MANSAFNRQTRKSGGERPARFSVPNLSLEDLEIIRQEAVIRNEFGEEGVRLFWERLQLAALNDPQSDPLRLGSSIISPNHASAGHRKSFIFNSAFFVRASESSIFGRDTKN